MAKVKSVQARTYVQKPDPDKYADHIYYEPDRIAYRLRQQGASDEDIKNALLEYINSEKEKCKNSFVHFCKYVFISGRGSLGIIQFEPEEYQTEIVDAFENNTHVVVNKSRQLGVSTVMAIYTLWHSIHRSSQRTLLCAISLGVAKELILKSKLTYEHLPAWLKPSCIVYSSTEIAFSNKSRFKALPGTVDAARSFAASSIICDEAAFIPHSKAFMQSLLPTISGGNGRILILSSPNGDHADNEFYNIAVGAKHGPSSPLHNGWHLMEIPWHRCKAYRADPDFKTNTLKRLNGDMTRFEVEYNCSFTSWTDSLFTHEALAAFKPSDKYLNAGGMTYGETLYIWEQAKPDTQYIIGVDMSSNKTEAKDYTCMQVLERNTFKQVAEYMGKLPTEVFADILVKTARHYNNAELVIEANSYADSLFYILEHTGYDNIWYNEKGRKGFNTNSKTRPFLIEKLLLVFNNPEYMSRLRSSRLKQQFENFGYTKAYADGSRKIEAKTGNDDLCFPAGTWINIPGGIKAIEDIKVGDLVLTHTGSYHPVVATGSRQVDTLHTINSVGKPVVQCTSEHPFYAYKSKIKWIKKTTTKNKTSRVEWHSPDWVTADALTPDHGLTSAVDHAIVDIETIDLLQYAAPSVVDNGGVLVSVLDRGAKGKCINPKGSKIKRTLSVDEDFCFILGYWLAKGSVGSHSVSWASHVKEAKFRSLVEVWATKCGINKCYAGVSSDNGMTMSFNNMTLRNFFKSMGSGSTKRLPAWAMQLPLNKQLAILAGYYAGDGCFSDGRARSTSISRHISYQIYMLLLRQGIECTLSSPRLASGSTGSAPSSVTDVSMGIPATNKFKALLEQKHLFVLDNKTDANTNYVVQQDQTQVRFIDGYLVGRLRENTVSNISNTIVYNMTVAVDNSYVANSYVVHNCMAMGMAIVTLAIGMTRDMLMPSAVQTMPVMYDPKTSSGETLYTEEYLDYYSGKLGLTSLVLKNRLKMYHDWKAGKFEGTPLGNTTLEHPVEAWEREQASIEFLGKAPIASDIFTCLDAVAEEINIDGAANQATKMYDIFDSDVQSIISYNTDRLNKAFQGWGMF